MPSVSRRRSASTGDLRVAGIVGAVVLVGLVVFALAGALAPDAVRSPGPVGWVLGVVALVVGCGVLLVRRTAPRTTLLATAAALLVAAAAGLGDAMSLVQLPVFVAAYSLGLAAPLSRTWPTYALAALVITAGSAVAALDGGEPASLAVGLGLVQGVLTVGLPLLVAIVVAARRETVAARSGREAALEREREALVQAAIARERTAMARELHDIAAHHLSGITVMTAAIGTQIDTDPAAAKAAVAQVRQQSKAVLQDLRSLVGLLRDDSAEVTAQRVRPESLAGVTALVEDVRAAGRDVRLTVLGAAEDLSHGVGHGVGPLAQLAAYRMVQESLSNAARHASGAAVEVTLDHRDVSCVVLTVRNGPSLFPGATDRERDGFGLVGMQERAELTGARLEAGPAPDGGWQVRLTLPRDATTSTSEREGKDA